jgi:hypothetical protein
MAASVPVASVVMGGDRRIKGGKPDLGSLVPNRSGGSPPWRGGQQARSPDFTMICNVDAAPVAVVIHPLLTLLLLSLTPK